MYKEPTIERVTDKYAWVQHYEYKTDQPYGEPKREKRFLCLRGPYDGQRRSWTELLIEKKIYRDYATTTRGPTSGYAQYNNAGTGPESMIYVWFGV